MAKNKSINFWLNGEEYCVNETINILTLIDYFDYRNQLLVLEHNFLICNRKSWKNVLISDSDRIEIVTIVGGG